MGYHLRMNRNANGGESTSPETKSDANRRIESFFAPILTGKERNVENLCIDERGITVTTAPAAGEEPAGVSEGVSVEESKRKMKWRPDLSRAVERPRPEDWAMDEPMTLYEAVAVHWPRGPATVSTLRNEIHAKRLPYRRIGRAYCVTREGLKVLGQCSLKGAVAQPPGKSLKSLLARHRAARNGIPGSHPDASGR